MASLFTALSSGVPLSFVIQALNSVMAALQGGVIDLTVSQAWTGLSYSNTWRDLAGWESGAWWKDPLGVVHLRGVLERPGGAPADGETIATLPLGARPSAQLIVRTGVQGGHARLNILATGVVQFTAEGVVGTPQTYVTLAGITFKAA